MLNYTDITGLIGVAIAVTAALQLLPGFKRLSLSRQTGLHIVTFILLLIPFAALPMAGYVRGASGDLSITTLLLLSGVLFRSSVHTGATEVRARRALLLCIAVAACGLYPMALGVGMFDPYTWGYGELQFIAVLLLLAVLAWWKRLPQIALSITLATFAWALGWYESGNLWDYLLDPFVAVYALFTILLHTIRVLYQALRFKLLHTATRG